MYRRRLGTIVLSITLVCATLFAVPASVHANVSTPTYERIVSTLYFGIEQAQREGKLTPTEAQAAKKTVTDVVRMSLVVNSGDFARIFSALVDGRESLSVLASGVGLNADQLTDVFHKLRGLNEVLPIIDVVRQVSQGGSLNPAQVQQGLLALSNQLGPKEGAMLRDLASSSNNINAALNVLNGVKTGDMAQAVFGVLQGTNAPPLVRDIVMGAVTGDTAALKEQIKGAITTAVVQNFVVPTFNQILPAVKAALGSSSFVRTAQDAFETVNKGVREVGQAQEGVDAANAQTTEAGAKAAEVEADQAGQPQAGSGSAAAGPSCGAGGGGGGGGGGGIVDQLKGQLGSAVSAAAGGGVAGAAAQGLFSGGISGAVGAVVGAAGKEFSTFIGNFLPSAVGDVASKIAGGAGGGGRGVPVIEQSGELLSTTKNILKVAGENLKTNTQNTNINTQSCSILANLLHIQAVVKPAQKAAVINAALEAAKGIADGAAATLITDVRVFQYKRVAVTVRRLVEVARKTEANPQVKLSVVKLLEEAKDQANDPYGKEDLSKLLAKTIPKGNETFLDAIYPSNSPTGVWRAIQEEIYRQLAEEWQRGYDEAVGNGYFANVTKCVPGQEDENGEGCKQEYITQPGSVNQRLLAEAIYEPVDILGDLEELTTPGGLSQLGAAAQKTPAYVQAANPAASPPPGAGQAILDSIRGGPEAAGSGDGVSDLLALLSSLCSAGVSLPLCDNGGGGTTTPPPTTTPPVVPAPVLTIASTTETVGGVTFTTLAWQGSNVSSCSAQTDWVSYGTSSAPTLDPLARVADESPLPVTGTTTIYHPRVFAVGANAIEVLPDENGAVPPSQANTITHSLSLNITNTPIRTTVTQRSVYSPITQGAEPEDLFLFGLNNLFISADLADLPTSVFELNRDAMISARLRSALTSATLDGDRKAEYEKYVINGTSTLNVTRAQEIEGLLIKEAPYAIECVAPNGATASDFTTITFVE
ncbi:MAG: hypothetical protein Q8P93_04440 [bacterium]|nr:hypothetical protein [bacterium]